MESKTLSYGETCINKNVFYKTSTNIDEVDISKITLLDKTFKT